MRLLLTTLLVVITGIWGEGATMQEAPTRDQVLEAARQIMLSARFATMITLDEQGHPQARVMDAFEPEPDLTVWFGTNPATRKVAELGHDARMTLSYFDPQDPGCVTLLGEARLVENIEEKQARFKTGEWEMFWPEGPESDDYVLIEFRPFRVEVISMKHEIANDPQGFKPAIVELGAR